MVNGVILIIALSPGAEPLLHWIVSISSKLRAGKSWRRSETVQNKRAACYYGQGISYVCVCLASIDRPFGPIRLLKRDRETANQADRGRIAVHTIENSNESTGSTNTDDCYRCCCCKSFLASVFTMEKMTLALLVSHTSHSSLTSVRLSVWRLTTSQGPRKSEGHRATVSSFYSTSTSSSSSFFYFPLPYYTIIWFFFCIFRFIFSILYC